MIRLSRSICSPPLIRLATLPRLLSVDTKPEEHKSIQTSDNPTQLPSTHVTVKVKQAAKDVWYSGVIIGGIALTGAILFAIFRELFSSKSPNGVYDAAFKLCKEDVRVQDLLGSSIKAYGEANSRGRRRHTAHESWYDTQGRLHMAMKFHLKGNLATGIVYLEVVENDAKDFEYRYLVVETEGGFTRKQVFVKGPANAADTVAQLQ